LVRRVGLGYSCPVACASIAPPSTTLHHILRRSPVAANCDVCGKKPSFGHSISHSHRRTKRRWNPNIQRVKALVGDAGVTPKRLNVCTSCLKAGKVKR
jgi:large subunit ribosomal protein L28